jgi:hypothetical protein
MPENVIIYAKPSSLSSWVKKMQLIKQSFYSYLKTVLSISLIILLTSSSSRLLFIGQNTRNDVKVRLGKSKYYIMLPDYLKIKEARGKEGQLGYCIIPKDTSSKIFGFIEIVHGNPIGGGTIGTGAPIALVPSTFLNQQIAWKIYKTETGYFFAETPEGDVRADASSNKRNEIDSMISIISTLAAK